jgi:hypothetical protein
MIEDQIINKFTGSSNTGKFILSFNDNAESKADITPVQLSDAHNQYQFLSTESMQKVMMSHRVTSPMLLGIKDQTGFGNNAEELKTASILFDNTVIRPFQRLLLDGVRKIMNANGYNLDIYFKTLQPLEFTDLSGKVVNEETKEKEFGFSEKKKVELEESFTDYPEGASNNAKRALKWVMQHGWGDCGTNVGKARAHQLANKEPISIETVKRMAAFRRHQQNKDVPYSQGCGGLMWDAWGGDSGISWAETKVNNLQLSADLPEFTQEIENEWLDYLKDKGEVIGEEFELIDESPVTDDNEYKFFKRFANPEDKSKDDKGVYLIRYRYAPMGASGNSRQFCKDMVANAKMGVVYRREDIDTMGDDGVNGQFAPSGKSNYSIWKYKGGVNCKHQWYRLTYMRKRVSGGKFIPLTPEEKSQAIKDLDNYKRVSNQSADSAGVPFSPPDWQTASTKTIDLPNKGSLKNK